MLIIFYIYIVIELTDLITTYNSKKKAKININKRS